MSGEAGSRIDGVLSRLLPEGSEGPDRQLRLYLAFVFALFTPTTLVFAVLDWRRGEHLTAILVGAISVVLLASLWTLRHAADIRWGYRLVLGVAVVLLHGVLFIGGGGGFAILWTYAFPAGFYYVFGTREGTAWVVGLGGPAAVLLFGGLGAEYPAALSSRYLVTYAMVTALALGLQWNREAAFQRLALEKERLEEALAQVRDLTEMFPMCAWCRNVRDDAGYWSKIEEYLTRRGGTVVTHGLCPDCAAKLDAGEGRPGGGAQPS